MAALEQSVDARDWAHSFAEVVRAHGVDPTDEAFMAGWFANAIAAGEYEGRRRAADEAFAWVAGDVGQDIAIRRSAVMAVGDGMDGTSIVVVAGMADEIRVTGRADVVLNRLCGGT